MLTVCNRLTAILIWILIVSAILSILLLIVLRLLIILWLLIVLLHRCLLLLIILLLLYRLLCIIHHFSLLFLFFIHFLLSLSINLCLIHLIAIMSIISPTTTHRTACNNICHNTKHQPTRCVPGIVCCFQYKRILHIRIRIITHPTIRRCHPYHNRNKITK